MPLRLKRDRGGDEQMRPLLRPGLPGHRQRQNDRLCREGIEDGEDAVLVEQGEARHQHEAGEKVRDIVGVVHASTPRVRKASRMARKANTKATAEEFADAEHAHLGDAHLPRAQQHGANSELHQPGRSADRATRPRPALAGAMPNGSEQADSSEM